MSPFESRVVMMLRNLRSSCCRFNEPHIHSLFLPLFSSLPYQLSSHAKAQTRDALSCRCPSERNTRTRDIECRTVAVVVHVLHAASLIDPRFEVSSDSLILLLQAFVTGCSRKMPPSRKYRESTSVSNGITTWTDLPSDV